MSIHEGLSEALATSLSTDRPHVVEQNPSLRSLSPGPSIRRNQSPAPSVRTVPGVPSSPAGGASLYSIRSADPNIGTTAAVRRSTANRSSWTSGLWVWSGAKQRQRRGSAGSLLSQAGTLGNVTEDQHREITLPDAEEKQEVWRKGDRGSAPSLRAIFLATVSS